MDSLGREGVLGQGGASVVAGTGGMWRARRALQGQGAALTGAAGNAQAVGMAVPWPSFPRCSGRAADGGHEILDLGGHEN